MDNPGATSGRCDTAKLRTVKLCVAVGEVWLVQDIDKRRLQLKTDAFSNRHSLGKRHIKIEVVAAVQTVLREIPKRAGIRLAQQSGIECCAGYLTAGVGRDVEQVRVEPEHAARRLEESNVLLEILKTYTHELSRQIVGFSSGGPGVEGGATGGYEEWWAR